MILKFLAGAMGVMLAEVGTTSGGRKVGSGVRAVGSALVMSSLGALGPPQGRRKSGLGCWRCGCTRRARGLVGGALGTLAFKGWAEDEQPPKGPRAGTGNERQGGKMADPEAAGVVGLSHLSVPHSGGLLYPQILGSHPAHLRQ